MGPRALARLPGMLVAVPARPASQTPTDREMEALRAYLATGSVKATAHLLGRHPQTIKDLLARVRRRLGVSTNAQAVAALELRLPK